MSTGVSISPMVPIVRREPFDDREWTFELKFDGLRGIANTIDGACSKRGNRMRRFEDLLTALPAGCIFDGEIIASDGTGRPIFADLMRRRGAPGLCGFRRARCRGRRLAIIATRGPQGDPDAPIQGGPTVDCVYGRGDGRRPPAVRVDRRRRFRMRRRLRDCSSLRKRWSPRSVTRRRPGRPCRPEAGWTTD
jgi:hypothetical protein